MTQVVEELSTAKRPRTSGAAMKKLRDAARSIISLLDRTYDAQRDAAFTPFEDNPATANTANDALAEAQRALANAENEFQRLFSQSGRKNPDSLLADVAHELLPKNRTSV